MESDGDMILALISFFEAATTEQIEQRVLHVTDCTEVLLERNAFVEPLEPRQCSSTSSIKSNEKPPKKKVSFHDVSLSLWPRCKLHMHCRIEVSFHGVYRDTTLQGLETPNTIVL